jgi:probable HAF family extracellular repeat protein
MRCSKALFLILGLVPCLEARVQADFVYTTLTAPNAFGTWAYGINDQGDIVGSYHTTAGGTLNGYILSNGGYTTIDNGSYLSTTVTGINSAGSIIGFYALPFLGNLGSFKVVDGTTTSLVVPGGTKATWASGINSLGQISGTYEDSNGNKHGFVLNGSTYYRIDDPSTVVGGGTSGGGINEKGEIVGFYDSKDGGRGFLLNGSTFTTISFSDSVSTYARGLNKSGQIVGDYVDSAGTDHGFLYSDGRYTTLDPPGATWTEAYGINAQGEIVGTYIGANGIVYGFTASAVPEPASAILLACGLGILFAAATFARTWVSGIRR